MVTVSLIAAVATNGVVGCDNTLPWHLPGDLRHFKRTTLGKPVVMGRRTWDSIGRPLPGRANIVISRQRDLQLDGASLAPDLDSALRLASEIAEAEGVQEVMVIGGAQIYAEALPLADRIYLTEVHAEVEGDAHFPDWDRSAWRETRREDREADENNRLPYSIVTYQRR